ncbi:MAG: DUF5688 family protein [Eubacteriales bacterium]|nr:DUF5688 family protein [Eubacteriales bacterium]
MSYEDFVCYIQTKMKEKLGGEVQVELHRITKNNTVILDGLSIQKNKSKIAPTVYLNEFYREYEKGMTIPEILECLEEAYHKSEQSVEFDPAFYSDFDRVKKLLACKLIHRERNAALLQNVPYQEFLDLAVVVYCRVESEVIGNGTILVYESHLQMWGITKEELFRIAKDNTRRLLPEEHMHIRDMIEDLTGEETPPDDGASMYVLTNNRRLFGAVNMIFDSVLEKIGKELNRNFWILPSSVHECILIPDSYFMERRELEMMVADVNRREVAPEDFLSNQVYFYERNLHRLSS